MNTTTSVNRNRPYAGLSAEGVENRIQRVGKEIAAQYGTTAANGIAAVRHLVNETGLSFHQITRLPRGRGTDEMIRKALPPLHSDV